jgi:hypothetical protein
LRESKDLGEPREGTPLLRPNNRAIGSLPYWHSDEEPAVGVKRA